MRFRSTLDRFFERKWLRPQQKSTSRFNGCDTASALLGLKSLTEYVVRLMNGDSTQVIVEHESITVEANVFNQFMIACHEAKAPNKALLEAASLTTNGHFK